MSSSNAAPRRGGRADAPAAKAPAREGRSAARETKPPMRDALIAAAFQLFLERGYEQTTVDDIVSLAGVGRRSFFRYFPSKEDVVFPDHEGCLAEVTAFLDAGDDTEDPVQRVCDAVRLVLRMYTENPAFSVQRYRLTKKVPGLRAYELSVVWRYERAFADYLRRRLADRPDGSLLADVVAAAVAAAHNNALRSWLRSDGTKDVSAEMDHALGFVRAAFDGSRPRPAPDGGDAGAGGAGGRGGPDGGQGGDGGRPGSAGEDDVVVLVSRRGAPLWKVVQRLETALAQDGDAGDRPGGRPGPAK